MEDRKSKKKGKAAGWTRHKAGTDPQVPNCYVLAIYECPHTYPECAHREHQLLSIGASFLCLPILSAYVQTVA